MQLFPEQSQASPVATKLLTLQAHEKKKEKNNTQNPVFGVLLWQFYAL